MWNLLPQSQRKRILLLPHCLWPPNLIWLHKPCGHKTGLTCLEWHPPIKSYNPWNTWSCKVTWQTENISFTLQRPPIKSHDYITMWSCEFAWQVRYIRSPFAYDQWLQILTGFWRAVTHQVIRTFKYVELKWHDSLITWLTWGHVKNWINPICSFKSLMALNLGKCWLQWGDPEHKCINFHQPLVAFVFQ